MRTPRVQESKVSAPAERRVKSAIAPVKKKGQVDYPAPIKGSVSPPDAITDGTGLKKQPGGSRNTSRRSPPGWDDTWKSDSCVISSSNSETVSSPHVGVQHRTATDAHQVGVRRQVGIVAREALEGQFPDHAGLLQHVQRGIYRSDGNVGEEGPYPLVNVPNRWMVCRVYPLLRRWPIAGESSVVPAASTWRPIPLGLSLIFLRAGGVR